jgi:hypothetical protein
LGQAAGAKIETSLCKSDFPAPNAFVFSSPMIDSSLFWTAVSPIRPFVESNRMEQQRSSSIVLSCRALASRVAVPFLAPACAGSIVAKHGSFAVRAEENAREERQDTPKAQNSYRREYQ